MRQVVIENPVLDSPFVKPTRHFWFTEEGNIQRNCRWTAHQQLFHPYRPITEKVEGLQTPPPTYVSNEFRGKFVQAAGYTQENKLPLVA